MPIPKRLYKYQPPSIQALTNLSGAKLWFSNPSRFNDPFDCALEASLTDVSIEDCLALLKKIAPNSDAQAQFLRQTSREHLQQEVLGAVQKTVAMVVGKTRGVCCFSEVVDDLLMWGHYAESHRGFCLEFDTSLEPLTLAKQVRYSDAFPVLDTRKFIGEDVGQVLEMLLTKASYWQYEKEWRSIHQESDKLFGYEREALTGIYFGAKMPEEQQMMIAALLEQTDTKLFRMRLSKSHFRVAPELFTFRRIDYRK